MSGRNDGFGSGETWSEGDAASEEGPEALVGSVLAGRYRLDALLGSGGMGAVYRAEHVLMRKSVAVKVLHQEMTVMEEAVKRFEREAIAAGRIEHPNVALATDFGRLEDGSFYLVLEYVAGRNLRDTIDSEGAMPVDRALIIARQIGSALDAAHGCGVVHRDLKPDNIMLIERAGSSDFVKVLDFGIAKVNVGGATAQLTQLGSVFGTPQYMAPEQAAGKPVDARVDVYALGLILHEMIRGRPVFESEEIIGLLTKQMTEAPPPLPPYVPEPVQALVQSLLEKDPERRPRSAADLVEQLDALIGPGRVPLDSAVAGAVSSRSSAEVGAHSPGVGLATTAVSPLDRVAERARRVTEALAPVADGLRPFARRLGRRLDPVIDRVEPVALYRIAGRVPVWAAAAAALAVVLVLLAVLPNGSTASPGSEDKKAEKKEPSKGLFSSDDKEEETAEPEPVDEPSDPELLRVIQAARRGSQPALYALEQRDEDERTTAEWLALAQGNLRRRKLDEALQAYEVALEQNPELVNDKTMLAGLRYFADRDSTTERALEFAAEHMGNRGADLLFHVWASTSRKTEATRLAWELLSSKSVRQRMSEPLKLALELRDAESCEDFKALLPRVERSADERSLLPLRDLLKDTGCGPDEKDDCYPCLRGDSRLEDAVTQVRMRNAPRFERPRRFR